MSWRKTEIGSRGSAETGYRNGSRGGDLKLIPAGVGNSRMRKRME